jgi:hypothetical protein
MNIARECWESRTSGNANLVICGNIKRLSAADHNPVEAGVSRVAGLGLLTGVSST